MSLGQMKEPCAQPGAKPEAGSSACQQLDHNRSTLISYTLGPPVAVIKIQREVKSTRYAGCIQIE
jgi:hypothetical protein